VQYPNLTASVAPERDGEAAKWFDFLRKSERQLYRVLGNMHYDHLAALLRSLDHCLERGFRQPRLLRTRARSSFAADLAELSVAEHFALLGAELSSFDEKKGGDPVPDLLVNKDGFLVAVEVYCALPWENLDGFRDELSARGQERRPAMDFVFRLEFTQLRQFDDMHRLLYLNEGALDELSTRRADLVADVVAELTAMLDDPPSSVAFARDLDDMNLRISVALDGIEYTRDRLPARAGFVGGPSTSGAHREARRGQRTQGTSPDDPGRRRRAHRRPLARDVGQRVAKRLLRTPISRRIPQGSGGRAQRAHSGRVRRAGRLGHDVHPLVSRLRGNRSARLLRAARPQWPAAPTGASIRSGGEVSRTEGEFREWAGFQVRELTH
jgi:hypothetical protein